MNDFVRGAHRLGIDPTQILVLARNTMVGMSNTGGIYMHRNGRWALLQPVHHRPPRSRRVIRYSGHPDSARSAHA